MYSDRMKLLQVRAGAHFMDLLDVKRIQSTEPPYEVVGWLDLLDDKVVIQTFNGQKRLNWLFNLALSLDRDILRKALDVHEAFPILAALKSAPGKLFPPQDYYKSY